MLPDSRKVTKNIIAFIKKTLKVNNFQKVILGWSGGLDSTTVLYLLSRALNPKDIYVVHLPYKTSDFSDLQLIIKDLSIPENNIQEIFIKKIVDGFWDTQQTDYLSKIRLGNIMTRSRMIIIYDLAKKNRMLVCGSENKSEYLLGYFTRYGDAASDFEPIRHLYKTQIFELAKYLNIPNKIIRQSPTAGLWSGQTDEDELGFSYQEADKVLYLYFEKKKTIEEIGDVGAIGVGRARKIIDFAKKNSFKHQVPYVFISTGCPGRG